MNIILRRYALPLLSIWLSACSSGADKTPAVTAAICEPGAVTDMQPIPLDTGEIKDASCTAKNAEGEWLLAESPGTISVKRSPTPLTITCIKTGYFESAQTLQAISKDKSVANLIAGNLFDTPLNLVDNPYEYPAPTAFTLTPVDYKAAGKLLPMPD